MPKLSIDQNKLLIDGKPSFIQAGTIHYYSLPHRDLWKPVLDKIRSCGLNAIHVAFPWSFHSPQDGFYDFTGPRDIHFLLEAAADAGLWLISHIGPWISSNLEAGGIPSWVWRVPGTIPNDAASLQSGLSDIFMQNLKSWWEKLLPFFKDRPNHLLTVVDPGKWSFPYNNQIFKQTLLDLAVYYGIRTPFAWPITNQVMAGQTQRFTIEGYEVYDDNPPSGQQNKIERPSSIKFPVSKQDFLQSAQWIELLHIKISSTTNFIDSDVIDAFWQNIMVVVLDDINCGSQWGYWHVRKDEEDGQSKISINESSLKCRSYERMRRLTFVTETISPILLAPVEPSTLYSSPEHNFKRYICTKMGCAAYVETGSEPIEHLYLSQSSDNEMLTTEGIYIPSQTSRIFVLNMPLSGGVIKVSTLEFVLITETAGRILCIIKNDNGGSMVLSDHFRPLHIRGEIHTQRIKEGWKIRINKGRLQSIVLDGVDKKVQLLALDSTLADRVWPLDDNWRFTPTYPAIWTPSLEKPAQGLIIGPDLVIPDRNNQFHYRVSSKGLGYRWGPWRGSDPRTWIAPFSWHKPPEYILPLLSWEHKAGGIEVLPEYPDILWREIPENASLAMEKYDFDTGFVWYRGRYSGQVANLTLQCRHDCDVYLNGHLIAAIKSSPHLSTNGLKKIPLPQRYTNSSNVIAILVENRGRAAKLDAAQKKHGLLMCQLGDNIPVKWRIRGGLQGEKRDQGFAGFADWQLVPHNGTANIMWHRSVFTLNYNNNLEQPVYFVLASTSGKYYVYLNGVLIGRTDNGNNRQRRFWMPEGLLNLQDTNELLIMQWTRGADPQLGETRLEAGKTHIWYKETYSR